MPEFLPNFLTADSGSVIGGMLLVIYAAITSLRKRRDITIAELEKRVASLEAELETLKIESTAAIEAANSRAQRAETQSEGYQNLLLDCRRSQFVLRTVLADEGLPDPTLPAA